MSVASMVCRVMAVFPDVEDGARRRTRNLQSLNHRISYAISRPSITSITRYTIVPLFPFRDESMLSPGVFPIQLLIRFVILSCSTAYLTRRVLSYLLAGTIWPGLDTNGRVGILRFGFLSKVTAFDVRPQLDMGTTLRVRNC